MGHTRDEARRKWIAALESGDYRQGRNTLREHDPLNGTLHCCLGVACDLVPGVRWEPTRATATIDKAVYEGDSNALTLPDTVAEYYGLTHAEQDHLAARNDHGSSFRDIARYIRDGILNYDLEYTYETES